jgi:HK97 family phage prohead protease
MSNDFERRTAKSFVQMRGKQLVGLAARYSSQAELPGFTETIAPGAFDKILESEPDVVCLFNHDSAKVLGRTSANTLHLTATHRGLEFSCELPDTSYANDLHESVKRGDVSGCSFAFNVGDKDQRWEERNGKVFRTITNFSALQDVSAVTHPAYSDTELDARAAALNEISAETRSRLESFVGNSKSLVDLAESRQECIDVLRVNLEYDADMKRRPIEDILELKHFARHVTELRSAGWTIELARDEDGWPVFVGGDTPRRGEREVVRLRRRRLLELLLD